MEAEARCAEKGGRSRHFSDQHREAETLDPLLPAGGGGAFEGRTKSGAGSGPAPG